ncbi:MAG: FAD-dependent oxidoreductase [Pseudomonadota bacterium]|nr:FAD-dependent oxidoreductase [Pseudomonadota bacterium]
MSSPTANIIDAGDVLIIGAGLAGLFTALKLAPRQVTVLTGGKRSKSAASNWAQGGIAAALAPGDSVEAHARDTCTAGAGLVDPAIARLVTSEAADRISDLETFGVRFDCNEDGAYIFGREAAHSHNRILSIYGDRTGREMMSALHARAAATP